MKPIFKHLFKFIVLLTCSVSAQAQVEWVSGYVRAMPASVPNSAAYLHLKNAGEATALISVETPIAKQAQLHTLIEKNAVISMREVERFNLPAQGELRLSETGQHIMLLDLKQPLVVGDNVDLVLVFDNGQRLALSLPVQKPSSTHEHASHAHHSHH